MKQPLLYEKLNLETARIQWADLERHFARGVVIVIDENLDLPNIAEKMACDDASFIQKMIQQNKIHTPTDQEALLWSSNQQEFWAVVVAPYVLIQLATSSLHPSSIQ